MRKEGRIAGFLCLPLLCLLVPASVHADTAREPAKMLEYGAKVGLTLSTLGGPDADRPHVESTYTAGYAINGFVAIKLHRYVSIQPELSFTTKGAGAIVDGVEADPFKSEYIELTLLARSGRRIGQRLSVYGLAGPGVGYLLRSRVAGDDRTDTTARVDIGIFAGVGMSVPAGPGALALEVRYNHGLSGLDKANEKIAMNRVIALMFGYQY